MHRLGCRQHPGWSWSRPPWRYGRPRGDDDALAALNALQIEAIAAPATEMLGAVLAAIPNVFAAAAIPAITYFVARLVSNLVSDLLAGLGFDRLPEKLGVAQLFISSSREIRSPQSSSEAC